MRALTITARVLALIVLFVASIVAHLPSPTGRRALGSIANAVLAGRFRGTLRVGSVDALALVRGGGRLVATGVTVDDPDGVRIVSGGTLEAVPLRALISALRGVPGSQMPTVRLQVDRMLLRPLSNRQKPQIAPNPWVPSIAETFQPRVVAIDPKPRPASTSAGLRFPNLELTVRSLASVLGNIEAEGSNLRARARLDTEPLSLTVRPARMTLRAMGRPLVEIDASLALHQRRAPWATRDAPDARAMRLAIEGQLVSSGARCTVTLLREDTGFDTADMRIAAPNCVAPSAALAVLVPEAGPLPDIELSAIAQSSGAGPLVANVDARIAGSRARIDARVESGDVPRQSVTLVLDRLALRSVRSTLPEGTLEGTLAIAHDGTAIAVDASQFYAEISGIPVPPFRAAAQLQGTQLRLESLTAPQLELTASGFVDLADVMHSDAQLSLRAHAVDLDLVPFVRSRAAGSVQLDVEARRTRGILSGTVDARAFALRTSVVRLARANVAASGRWNGAEELDLRANVDAQGVVVPGAGPFNVRLRAEGDPRGSVQGTVQLSGVVSALAGSARAGATMPVRPGSGPNPHAPVPRGSVTVSAPFRVALQPGAIRAELGTTRFAAQGATGTLVASATIPRGRSTGLDVRAHLRTQGAGLADVALRDESLNLRFEHFDAAWLGQVSGQVDWLDGRIDGSIALRTNALSSGGGTLTWRDGRLPTLGGFDLTLRVAPRGAQTELGLELEVGDGRAQLPARARQGVSLLAHVNPPRSLANARGWVDGLRDGQFTLRNLDLAPLRAFLPSGYVVEGLVGAQLDLRRAGPREPLDARIAVDGRNLVPSLEATASLPGSLRGLVSRTVAPRPLTHPLRTRVALCARVLDPRYERIELRSAVSVGREVREPDVPPPLDCTAAAVSLAAPLVHAAASLRGPWRTALEAARTELARSTDVTEALRTGALSPGTRRLLDESRVQLAVSVGPIDNEHWPFAPAIARLSPALRRSPIPGTANVTLRVENTLLVPHIRVESQLDIDDLAALASHDALHVEARAEVIPDPGAGSLFGPVQMRADATAALLARAVHGTSPAGSAQAAVRVHGELRRLLDPDGDGAPLELQQVELRTDNLDIGRLAWARARSVSGSLSLRARATGDPVTPVTMAATLTNMQVRNQNRSAGVVAAFLRKTGDAWEVQACTRLQPGDGAPPACDPDEEVEGAPEGGLRVGLTLPFVGPIWRGQVDTDGAVVALSANRFRLETVSPLVETPPIARIGGALSTERLSWSASAPTTPSGRIQLREGLVEIDRIGQPWRGINLDVEARARRLNIERLTLSAITSGSLGPLEVFAPGSRGVQGGLSLRGTVDLRAYDRSEPDTQGDMPRRCAASGRSMRVQHNSRERLARVHLDLDVNRLPAMFESRTYAAITALGQFNGELFRSGLRGELALSRLSVNVPDEPSRDLQETDANGAVFVLGESRVGYSAPSRAFPIDLAFCTQEPFWARRSDFDIAAQTRGAIHYDRAGVALDGSLELRSTQSYFDLLGKRFFFDRINIAFDGGTTVDPSLDVQARYESTGTGRIRVVVSGRLSEPSINFISERFPEASQSDVIALLVLGRRDSRGVGEQTQVDNATQQAATQLLTGVLLGFASDFVRNATREGQMPFVARPILEPGANGQVGRYGAGVTLNAYNRLYFEGTYGTPTSSGSSNSGTALGQEGRLFVEWSATDHISLGGTFGFGSSAGGATTARTALDVFINP